MFDPSLLEICKDTSSLLTEFFPVNLHLEELPRARRSSVSSGTNLLVTCTDLHIDKIKRFNYISFYTALNVYCD